MTHTDCHLLIVDDDERIRALLGRFLRKNGYMVTMARDAVQAVFCEGTLDYMHGDVVDGKAGDGAVEDKGDGGRVADLQCGVGDRDRCGYHRRLSHRG